MLAALLETDGSLALGEAEEPVPGDGQALVEVAAAGLNPIDLVTAGADAAATEGPVVGGREGVGTLDGRRFYFGAAARPSGSLAERAVVPAGRLIELPDEVGDDMAIALGVAGQAAWLGLEWRARLRRGEHVLVLGAGGTVGALAIQFSRLLGAGRVVAAARSEAGLDRARELGADAVVRLPGEDRSALAGDLADAAAGRVDVVLDALWGEPAMAALAAATRGARVVQVGSAAGTEVSLNPGPLRGRLVDLLPFSSGAVPGNERVEAYRRTLQFAVRRELRVESAEMPLEQAPAAWERQARGPGAKLLVRVR